MNLTYVLARSESSYNCWIMDNKLNNRDFFLLKRTSDVHAINRGSCVIFLSGQSLNKDNKLLTDLIRHRADILRLRSFK